MSLPICTGPHTVSYHFFMNADVTISAAKIHQKIHNNSSKFYVMFYVFVDDCGLLTGAQCRPDRFRMLS